MRGLLPPVREVALDPATRLFLVPWRRVPLVHLRLHLEGGSDLDPPGRDGTARLATELLETGAGERDRAAFARALDALGARFWFEARRAATHAVLDLPRASLRPGSALLRDGLVAPRLDKTEFAKIRRRARQDWVLLKENNPGALAAIAARAWLFGRDHPEGRLDGGEEATLARSRHADAVRFHRRLLEAPQRWLIAVGDVEGDGLEEIGREILAALAPPAPAFPPPPPPAPGPTPILLLDRPGSRQAYLWLGRAATPDFLTLDFLVLQLAIAVLGGHFLSLLNRRLRVEKGLTYGAHASWTRGRTGGWVALSTYTETENCASALGEIFAILDACAQDGPPREDVGIAARYLRGQHPFGFESPGGIAASVEAIAQGFRTRAHEEEYDERISAIGPDALREVAREHFPGRENFRLAVVGDARALAPALETFGPLTVRRPGARSLFEEEII